VTHHYEPDTTVTPDHRGVRPCLHCPLPRANAVHAVPEVPDDVKAAEARRVGEGVE
jgi:hypothetical protein